MIFVYLPLSVCDFTFFHLVLSDISLCWLYQELAGHYSLSCENNCQVRHCLPGVPYYEES